MLSTKKLLSDFATILRIKSRMALNPAARALNIEDTEPKFARTAITLKPQHSSALLHSVVETRSVMRLIRKQDKTEHVRNQHIVYCSDIEFSLSHGRKILAWSNLQPFHKSALTSAQAASLHLEQRFSDEIFTELVVEKIHVPDTKPF